MERIYRSQIKLWLFVGIVLVLGGVLFRDVVSDLWNDWTRFDTDSYGLVLLLLSGWFVFKEREKIRNLKPLVWWPGVAIQIIAIIIFFMGRVAVEYYSQGFALVLLVTGIIGFLCGTQALRVLSFPIFFLFLSIPFPAIVANNLTLPLKSLVSFLSAEFFHLIEIPVFREGNILHLSGMTMEVETACSGIRSILALVIIALLISRDITTGIRKMIFFLLILPLSVMTNSLRVIATGVMSHIGFREGVLASYHFISGWLFFILALVLLFGLKKKLFVGAGIDKGRKMKNQKAIIRNRLRDRFSYPLVLFVLVLALLMNSWIEMRQKHTGAFENSPFPYVMDSWRGYDLALDPKAIELLNPDQVIFRRYENPERIPADLYLIVYFQQQRDRTFHSPANCYPGSGWTFQNNEAILLTGLRNPEFTVLGRKVVIQKGIDSRVMYYWFFAGGQAAANEYKTKLLTMYNAIVTGRTDGGLITVSGAITDQEQLEKEFLPRIIDQFAGFWTN